MRDRNRKIATIIVGGMTPPEGKKKMEEEDVSGLTVAAEEILMAIDEKDAEMLSEALKNFYEMCQSAKDEESEEADY